jgi:mannitol-1-/sugar-/sorbitol-6-phosphatase
MTRHRFLCKALLFDLDGVLADTTALVEATWAEWAESRGLDRGLAAQVHGRPTAEIISDVTPELDPDHEAREIESWQEGEIPTVTAVEGALELVGTLPPGSWAVVTSGTRSQAAARLAAIDLDAPAVVITSEDIAAGKPDPEPYLTAAARLGIGPEDCVVFEDAPAGLASGRAAGMRTIGVTTTMGRELLEGADHVVDSLRQIRAEPSGERIAVEVYPPPSGR